MKEYGRYLHQQPWKDERIQETADEIDDGRRDTWILTNHESLVNEFVEENPKDFKEYCEIRWREINE